MQVEQKQPLESHESSSFTQENIVISNSKEERGTIVSKAVEDSCPVCHEKLGSEKMVFQCGHVTCCKCNYLIT